MSPQDAQASADAAVPDQAAGLFHGLCRVGQQVLLDIVDRTGRVDKGGFDTGSRLTLATDFLDQRPFGCQCWMLCRRNRRRFLKHFLRGRRGRSMVAARGVVADFFQPERLQGANLFSVLDAKTIERERVLKPFEIEEHKQSDPQLIHRYVRIIRCLHASVAFRVGGENFGKTANGLAIATAHQTAR